MHIRRKQLRLTQKDVAYRAGISPGGYQKIELGANVTVENLEKISKVLEVPLAFWWDDQQITLVDKDEMFELKTENQKLRKQIERDQRTIDRLLEQLDKIEGKDRKRATG